jgi:diguanylate cyclase (GGDEF)-like protein
LAVLVRDLPLGRRLVLYGLASIAILGMGVVVLHDMLGVGGARLDAPITNWVQANTFLIASVLCLLRVAWVEEERMTWLALGVGIGAWWPATTLFQFYLSHLNPVPYPTISDAFWLASYPCFYAAIVLGARRQMRHAHASLWLDGLVGGLAFGALAASVVLQAVLGSIGGSPAAVATNLAYPLADVLLLGFLVGIFALSGWRPGRRWLTLAAGMCLLFVADSIFLYEIAKGLYGPGNFVDPLWPAAMFTLAFAAWQRPAEARRLTVQGERMLVLPSLFMLIAVGVLIVDHLYHLNPVAVGLAVATLLVVMVRTALAFRELGSLSESRREARTDELTGLPNRRFFLRQLETSLNAAAEAGASVPLLLVDLDHFKELNDTLGHRVGDQLLEQIGSRLRDSITESATVARLGGDEFAVLLAVNATLAEAEQAAVDLRAALVAPMALEDITLRVDASVGIAAYPQHAQTGVELLQRADIAMYQAKASRTGHELYAAERDGLTRARLALVAELRDAIELRQLTLHYQPKADLASGAITSVEALVRWPHPTHGLIPPGDFLPMAEQTGLMPALTLDVLDQALEQCSRWHGEGLPIGVAVNLSAANLLDLEFDADVARLLTRWNVQPNRLELEITENVLMADPTRARDVLERLRRLGVTIALDDFGTGYSSLAYLKQLPVDTLKIDQAFVTNLRNDPDDHAIVRAIIALAQSLGLHTVAEGVEDADSWRLLARLNCDLAQGYHLSRPLPADQLTTWLRATLASSDSEADRPAA